MGDFLNGLEKFGLDSLDMNSLFEDVEKPQKEEPKEEKPKMTLDGMKEEDYLLTKNIHCPVCDHAFQTMAVKSSKARRIGMDKDLRPRFQGIDTIKYNIDSCPYCGYTAMSNYFTHLSTVQIKMIKEGVSSKFQPSTIMTPGVYTYDYALDKYKLALYNTVVKKGKVSEKAYTCLRMSWLCRGKAEEMINIGLGEHTPEVKACRKEEMTYYAQAYEGFCKAISSESFPICGMDQNAMDLLLAQMAFTLQKYEMASRLVARLLSSSTASRNAKDRALELKEEILAILKAGKS